MTTPQMKNIAKAKKVKRTALSPLVKALNTALKTVFTGNAGVASASSPSTRGKVFAAPGASVKFESMEPRVLMSADVNPAQVVTGALDVPGQTDQYGFTLTKDASIVFDSLTNNSRIHWTLTGPEGTTVSARCLSESDSADAVANPCMQLKAGEYTLTVDGQGDTTGSYAFRLIDLERTEEFTPGSRMSGTLDRANETDVYRFSATAGERFYFDRQINNGGNAYWRLIDPNGQPVFGPTHMSNDVDVTTLTVDGKYSLLIEGRASASGSTSYSFNVQKIHDDARVIAVGQSSLLAPNWTAGKVGGALVLDGTRHLEIAHNASVDLAASLTLEAWFKVDRFANIWTPLFQKGSPNGSNDRTYSLWLNADGSVHFTTSDGDEQYVQTNSGLIRAGEFAHIAGVIDRSTGQMRLYINGVQAASGKVRTTAARSHTNPLLIGRTLENNSSYGNFEGVIDDIRVWNVARTAQEIAAAKDSALVGTEAGLVVYLKADDETGDVLADASSRRNHATIASSYGNHGVLAGRIDHAGQRDFTTFTLDAAKQLYLDSLTNNDKLNWTLMGPQGVVVSDRTFASTDASNLSGSAIYDLVAGSYTLMVDGVDDTTGSYGLRLLDITQATPLTLGTPVSSQLNPSNETDL